jgi:hypothetical protein
MERIWTGPRISSGGLVGLSQFDAGKASLMSLAVAAMSDFMEFKTRFLRFCPAYYLTGSPGITKASASSATAIHSGARPVVPDTIARISAKTARMKLTDISNPSIWKVS